MHAVFEAWPELGFGAPLMLLVYLSIYFMLVRHFLVLLALDK